MNLSSVVTVGNFDGVHLGHRAILDRARALADARGVRAVALSFDPHPATTLRPGLIPPRLCTAGQKVDRLRRAGADEVVLLEPTPELLGQSPEQFVEAAVAAHRPEAFVEGPDFRFGKGRAGDLDLLRRLGQRIGFEVEVVPVARVVLTDRQIVTASSSLVRWLLGRGRVGDAALCLGEPYALEARVVRGEQRGRVIGVPTANLDPAAIADRMVPADGVYAGIATTGDERHAAAISVGTKPTFGAGTLSVEAHLLDVDTGRDLYGQDLCLRFEHWIRDQYAFGDLDELKAQIARDLAAVRGWRDAGPTRGPRPAVPAQEHA